MKAEKLREQQLADSGWETCSKVASTGEILLVDENILHNRRAT